MTGARSAKDRTAKDTKGDVSGTSQIEYLLYQSTQGIHFMFENSDIAKIMRHPTEDQEFFTTENREKVQGLLSSFLNCPSMQEKKSYLESLPKNDFELLLRAYFQLVENTILAHSNIRH